MTILSNTILFNFSSLILVIIHIDIIHKKKKKPIIIKIKNVDKYFKKTH